MARYQVTAAEKEGPAVSRFRNVNLIDIGA